MMTQISAMGVSPGFGVGTAYVIEKKIFDIPRDMVLDTQAELMRFECALERVIDEVRELLEMASREASSSKADIVDAYLMLLKDPETTGGVRALIAKSYNAPLAVSEAIGDIISVFEDLEDAYMRERSFDIRDIMNALLRELLGVKRQDLSEIPPGSVIIAEDLAVSDTAKIKMSSIEGIITALGGQNSHTSIVARGFEIPAIVGARDIMDTVSMGDEVLLDGASGAACIRPTPDVKRRFIERREAWFREKASLGRFAGIDAVTMDGVRIEVMANIGVPSEVGKAIENTADGIGLFRSEFLYLDRDNLPGEEYQFEAYRAAAEAMGTKIVVIRTMDIGGDKQLACLGIEKEDNPYLGYRAIRVSLDRAEIFRTQLRAILRASHFGHVRVLIPFVSSLEEIRQARAALEKAMDELRSEDAGFDEDIKLGAMIEVPSAAILAGELAAECDFFAIGTNDLIQYTLAVDRGNNRIFDLYTPCHPAVLRLVYHVVKSAAEAEIPCCACGEMAGDPALIPMLLGMGMRSLSMSAGSILKARAVISSLCLDAAERLAGEVLACGTSADVRRVIDNFSCKSYSKNKK